MIGADAPRGKLTVSVEAVPQEIMVYLFRCTAMALLFRWRVLESSVVAVELSLPLLPHLLYQELQQRQHLLDVKILTLNRARWGIDVKVLTLSRVRWGSNPAAVLTAM